MKRSGVLLVGPYPPPYGGVSVHIKRLFSKLRLEGIKTTITCQPGIHTHTDCASNIFSARISFNWETWLLQFYSLSRQYDIIHFHTGWEHVPAAYFLLKHGAKILFSFHDQQIERKLNATDIITKWCTKKIAENNNCCYVAVSRNIMEQLIHIGLKQKQINVIPAFLFPNSSSSKLPDDVIQFFSCHTPVLSIYGWRTAFDDNSEDIYGFDYTLTTIAVLKKSIPNVGLIVLIPSGKTLEYITKLKGQANSLGLASNVLFITNPYENAYAIWEASDIFLRPTLTDGDAVSVREALLVGTPVIASDAVFRPEGVTTFDRSSIDNLVNEIHKELSTDRNQSSIHTNSDYFDSLLDVYKELGVQH